MTSDDGEQVADLTEGGYLDHRYDAGGILPVSLGLVANDTGHPERVLTPAQIDAELAKAPAVHCAHWDEGDGPCCRCGEPNWCPDEGTTPEAEARFERRKHCEGSA